MDDLIIKRPTMVKLVERTGIKMAYNIDKIRFPSTSHVPLLSWVERMRKICRPSQVQWCDGSELEYKALCDTLVSTGTFVPLNPNLRPNSYLARTDGRDTYRPDEKAVISCQSESNAGPTNIWVEPKNLRVQLDALFNGCMQGRTMFVIPFCMGPIGSSYSRIGVEVTDSPYTVVNMRIVTRIGNRVLEQLGDKGFFLPCVHSVGYPLIPGGLPDVPWPCNPDKLVVAHFTDELEIWSYGSGFGGNSMLSKRSFGLRIASALGKKEPKWLTTHCSVLSLTSPEGKKYYLANGFPTGTAKTNISLLVSTLPGWTQNCISNEISWMNVGQDGRLYAINPENGFFGVAYGMNDFTNRPMMDAMQSNTIFTNVAMTMDGDVWWEGMTKEIPSKLVDWRGQIWTPDCERRAAHVNCRYTLPASQCPIIDADWDNPKGVPISAFIFAHRRASTVPIVHEAFSWQHGIFMGCSISVDDMVVRERLVSAHRDSLSMTDFSGCNINELFSQWLTYRQYLGYSSPRVFAVNWFLQDKPNSNDSAKTDGSQTEFLWPGYGENSRILKWICERIDNRVDAVRTAIGYVPSLRTLDTAGLDLSQHALQKLVEVNPELWMHEVLEIRRYFSTFGSKFPAALIQQLDQLEKRLHLAEGQPPTHNEKLLSWVQKTVELCRPMNVHWYMGTLSEYDQLCAQMVDSGQLLKLNEQLRPNCYLARSDPRDVAHVESRTFICSEEESMAGPTNNWADPKKTKEKLNQLLSGCMQGRTMYIVPFCMGPISSPYSRYGVEITDSPYVVINMYIMVRVGMKVLTSMGDATFLPCLHTVGMPLKPNQSDVPWPCNPEDTVIAHFPSDPSVISYGSGYGGNALLGKKCFALRIASVMARQEGWLAEHMLILSVVSPEGKKYYMGAAFPSACGKTNLAMLVPTLPGWTVRCVGDDIAWLHLGENGRLSAINPEAGFFGVAPGTSEVSNPSAMRTVRKNTIFTNVALTPEGDVWWEGMTKQPPANLIDWTGQAWVSGCGRPAAHPNSRYTTPTSQCPVIDPEWENPNGVPISAIIFGSRRSSLVPLVVEAFSWSHGTFLASTVASEQTAAAEGQRGLVRRDPFAMLPFCGYNMADYFRHWIEFRNCLGYNSPKIFQVNWFIKSADGRYLWPGFGENSRVLKWIFMRIGRNPVGKSIRTVIGHIPAPGELDLSGLDVTPDAMSQLLKVDRSQWLTECQSIHKLYGLFNDDLPTALRQELYEFECRLNQLEIVPPTTNKRLMNWIEEVRNLCQPTDVHWVTGGETEYQQLVASMLSTGTLIKLNEQLRPNCYLARSDPRDVARVESRTFICSEEESMAGPTNNWADPKKTKEKLNQLLSGCMQGRTMYIVPFCMGPISSPYSRYGVEITDSPYVVINMYIMVRVGMKVLTSMGDATFLPCLHTVGMPLKPNQSDVPWPCNPEDTVIAHFPSDPSVISYGSGYGGNALLGKKCFALRIASVMARQEGWLAEHMLILSVVSPEGKKYYMGAAFPSACGKTNLAMLVPTLPGWTVRCVGDDIAWLHLGENGRLSAINPEAGFFGVAPGTSEVSNPSAMRTVRKNTIFTNVALTPEGDVWWEGMTKQPPANLIDWTGQAWVSGCGRPAAHPNSRYTTPASQCPVIDPEWENPNGVPICAILFGGRRSSLVPLVTEAFIWEQGVFMASTIASEQTAAAEGQRGLVRRDPFAMLPFCGYNMADYFRHWIEFRRSLGYLSPKIFQVNWFVKSADGRYLWPGFGENSRVLKWICERVDGVGQARPTAIGYVPTHDALDTGGLDLPPETIHKLTHVDHEAWLKEIPEIRAYYNKFGDRLPAALWKVLDELESRLHKVTAAPTSNPKLLSWVDQVQQLCQPSNIYWCTGTQDEYDDLCDELVNSGTLIRLNSQLRPNSFLARTHPDDASADHLHSYLCSTTKEEAGIGGRWHEPSLMRERLDNLFSGSMRGRTMYIIPFVLGPCGSPYARYGVQITDSPLVVVNMFILTRMGTPILSNITANKSYIPILHSMGYPLIVSTENEEVRQEVPWPCDPKNRVIAHFPDDLSVWSYGSNFGSNVLAPRMSFGLRIASLMARREGWLAARMAILALTPPSGPKQYIAFAAPEDCGKTNLAMLVPTVPGWTVRCISDDIAWLHANEDSCLWAINPQAGFFDRATTQTYLSNRSAVSTLRRNAIFINTALTSENDVWWEGLTKGGMMPTQLIDWQGKPWHSDCNYPAAHNNAIYIAPISQCPVIDPDWNNPNGVPISAIVFGNRRKSVLPLVIEAPSWERGIFFGSTISVEYPLKQFSSNTIEHNQDGGVSESSLIASSAIPTSYGLRIPEQPCVIRHPFTLYGLVGYNICEHFSHWISYRQALGYNIPKIFAVNWFRAIPNTSQLSTSTSSTCPPTALWPGFDENSRILKWIYQRINNVGQFVKTPIGFVPPPSGLDLRGLDISVEDVAKVLAVSSEEWKDELEAIEKYYQRLGSYLPKSLSNELQRVKAEFEY